MIWADFGPDPGGNFHFDLKHGWDYAYHTAGGQHLIATRDARLVDERLADVRAALGDRRLFVALQHRLASKGRGEVLGCRRHPPHAPWLLARIMNLL